MKTQKLLDDLVVYLHPKLRPDEIDAVLSMVNRIALSVLQEINANFDKIQIAHEKRIAESHKL